MRPSVLDSTPPHPDLHTAPVKLEIVKCVLQTRDPKSQKKIPGPKDLQALDHEMSSRNPLGNLSFTLLTPDLRVRFQIRTCKQTPVSDQAFSGHRFQIRTDWNFRSEVSDHNAGFKSEHTLGHHTMSWKGMGSDACD